MLEFDPEVTEEEWLQEPPRDAWGMWRSKPRRDRRRVDRKELLLIVALFRSVADLLTDPRALGMAPAVERYADEPGEPEAAAALDAAGEQVELAYDAQQPTRAATHAVAAARNLVSATHDSAQIIEMAVGARAAGRAGHEREPDWYECAEYRAAVAAHGLLMGRLIRDVFGNPFRPVVFSPSWRTGTATALARQMYETRDFSAMPILADALQDAGCDDTDALDHCRGSGPHVRGCWVVDLVLGKE
ncbi:hypothetical protein [Frigoriglobus tundricola]|uniref:SMI1/KNR4 family protein n=1 Tax=Frigoriglobus tundricola TaxID=2774151 RepID=A0A6M5YKE5_9BACT|nr:hypothetical protein [Frigoriglobus tundricola]QJW93756.1 hypothetical protein FTUN_1267 [Frigoriglobus tundricola]